MRAVILCGGKASRLSPLTDTLPKSLIEVAGRPFIFSQLDLLREADIKHVLLCVGYLGNQIQKVVGSHYRGMTVGYSFDGRSNFGTAAALRQALPLLSHAFYVIYGDSFLDCDYGAIGDAFFARRAQALLTVIKNDDPRHTNNVLMENGKLIVYDKARPQPSFGHIDYGLSILTRAALMDCEGAELSESYQDWSCRGRLAAYEVEKPFHEIGSFEGLAETRKYLESKR